MHIGLFGGTFDPPHICHTLLCVYVLEMTDIDKIIWAPCVDHPFGKTAAPFEHRLAMSRLAAESLAPRVEVSDIERDLPRPNYTIHTVEALRRRRPDARLSLVIGSDNLADLDRWHAIERLRREIAFVVVPRQGIAEAPGEFSVVLPNVNSTAIRAALRERRAVDGVLTPRVRGYIDEHGLYR